MQRILTTIALLFVFGTSAYMSISGLMAFLAGNQYVALCAGIGLELGKIICIIYLHRRWDDIRWLGRIGYIIVISSLVFMTSTEVLGFLSLSHSDNNSLIEYKAANDEYQSLEAEKNILIDQLKVIDDTLIGLPVTYVSRRFREREKAGYIEKQQRVLEITRRQTVLKQKRLPTYSGPVFAAARIFKVQPERAAGMFIFFLVAIMEPLSIGLAVATSVVWLKPFKRGRINNGQKILTVQAKKIAESEIQNEFINIREKYSLTIPKIAQITDKRKISTVERWVNGHQVIPMKSLRKIRNWQKVHENKLIRMAN
ncbi:MAG: hypothetical protein JRF25_13110 [Deltaproteobacteria bacterium]|nr:hypothetical protein [Deltaproteobacteria bacterium]